ncbi:DUF59 domain-containing protein [Candidatus Jorgensenbacteria bacterium]|nr:DUF59 domain-containing protein [Candidatus Jorgensenbacteria bacterium]
MVRFVSEEDVWSALRECYDPEIPVNIVDLGLVYEVKIEDNVVSIKMTLTNPMCFAAASIAGNVRGRLLVVPGVKDARVEIVFDPPWDQSRMSDTAKLELGFL